MNFSQNKVLTFKQACQYLGYAKSYMYKLTSSNIIPCSKPNGKKIFFDREKLEKWMLSRETTSQAEKQKKAATYIKTKQKH